MFCTIIIQLTLGLFPVSRREYTFDSIHEIVYRTIYTNS